MKNIYLTVNVIYRRRLIPTARTLLEGRDTNEFLLNIIIDADLIGVSHAGDFSRLNIHLKYVQKIYGARQDALIIVTSWRPVAHLLFRNSMWGPVSICFPRAIRCTPHQ